MKTQRIVIVLALILVLGACEPQPTPPLTAVVEITPGISPSPIPHGYRPGSWIWRTPYQWIHDGEPYESEHFWVYTDGGRLEDKVRFSEEAEKSLAFILDTLQIEEQELHFPPGHKKLEIFASIRNRLEFRSGYAYYGGFLFTYDPEAFRVYSSAFPGTFQYGPLFTHEITHEVGFLLIGNRAADGLLTQTWFDEGLASLVAQYPPYKISYLSQLTILRQELVDVPDQGNPTMIRRWEDIPSSCLSDEKIIQLYAAFELAVRYLVDTYGIETFKNLYLADRAGLTFEEAFQEQYVISLVEFQETFFTLMESYLPK